MGAIVLGLSILAAAQILRFVGQRKKYHHHYTALSRPPQVNQTDIVIHGWEFAISSDEIAAILCKRFSYYSGLNYGEQQRFLERAESFIRHKTFIIKDEKGFKEMPVLVVAAAIQLTFGLKDYRLPFYKYIRIYPEEYFGETLKVLAGNVQDNIITVAWNHLLQGLENSADGKNVGLHEMSHALYFQKTIIEQNSANRFNKKYNSLLKECRTAFEDEVKGHVNLYTDYATSSLQEFWAESVELFFEKPAELKATFPLVFTAMTVVLNQNPLNKQSPVISKPFRVMGMKII